MQLMTPDRLHPVHQAQNDFGISVSQTSVLLQRNITFAQKVMVRPSVTLLFSQKTMASRMRNITF